MIRIHDLDVVINRDVTCGDHTLAVLGQTKLSRFACVQSHSNALEVQ